MHHIAADTELASALRRAEDQFRAANPLSERAYHAAASSLPGGNTRTGLHFAPFPLTIASGKDQYVTDVDGHVYADLLGDYSAGLYGHSNPVLLDTARHVLDRGVSFGGPTRHEASLADLLSARFPSVERVRFTNSGTEANLMAIATAREHTGKAAVLAFSGGYHGSLLSFRGHAPLNVPYPFLVGTFNDVAGAAGLIRRHSADLAAVIVEPVIGGGGVIPGTPGFLRALREATAAAQVMLIFDEVMTSRLAPGGYQELVGVRPDLTTFGKYLGGGFSFGAFGGPAAVMERYDPAHQRSLGHPGTFNNNPVSMALGAAGLRDVYTPEVALAHNRRGDDLRGRLNEVFAGAGAAMQATGHGSLIGIHFQRGPISEPNEIVPAAAKRALLHLELLARGFYTARRGYLALPLPLSQVDVDNFSAAVRGILREHGPLFQAA
jgi:glutamate-1-semialdehyde 2,1-aminomutase